MHGKSRVKFPMHIFWTHDLHLNPCIWICLWHIHDTNAGSQALYLKFRYQKKMKTKVPRFFSFHSYYPIHPNIKRKIPHRPRCCWESPRNPRWSRSVRGFSDSGWIFGLILKNIYGKTMETMENHGYLPRNQSRNVKFQEWCIMGQWNSSCNSPPDK